MKKIATAAALLALLAAGCQSGKLAQGESPLPTAGASESKPVSSAAPTPSPSLIPSPTPSPKPTAAPGRYKMNKNYDIVPAVPDAQQKVVLLTFDDGPKEKKQLETMLDALDKHKAKAVFFVNGYRVKQNPELLKLIHDRGQTVGNHSWDHIDLKKQPDEKADRQIEDVQKIVKDITGAPPRFFRPPFGSGNDHVREKAKSEGLLYMTWSVGSLDWDTKTEDKPKEVIDNVIKQLHPGSNILMHELPWTAETLDNLLTRLEEKGYGFVDPGSIEAD